MPHSAARSAIADAVAVAAPEPYHVVGAPGEPPFLNGCERRHFSLPGVDADLAAPALYKDREGVVHFRGALEYPAPGAAVFKGATTRRATTPNARTSCS
jgi:hypothetical protein